MDYVIVDEGHCCRICYNRMADTSSIEQNVALVALLPCWSQDERAKDKDYVPDDVKKDDNVLCSE